MPRSSSQDAGGAPAVRGAAPAGLLGRAGLDGAARTRRLAFLDFGSGDAANLAELRAFAATNVDGIVDDFYRHLLAFEETRRILESDERIAQLKKTQRAYFLRMLEANFDREYFESWLLRRVLNNLVVNAIRHSAAGRVDLSARLAGENGDRLEIRVRDGGRGIPPEELATLFERVPRQRGAHREDTGLGLIFCKMALERMGGTITVESRLGSGTTFVIALPPDASP